MVETTPNFDALKSHQRARKSARANGAANPAESERPLLDPRAPLPIAREFGRRRYMAGGLPTLHYHRGDFYAFNGSAYGVTEEPEIRAALYDFLDRAERVGKDGKPEPFRPNRAKVTDTLDALKATTILPAEIAPPAWLDQVPDLNGPPGEYLVVRNGLLHRPTRDLHAPTPAFFATNTLPVSYEPNAPPPTAFIAFLHTLWPNDAEARETLQELFGYLLTTDTSQQKLFLLVGPKRAGKGTIARVLTAMLGRANVAGPTLNSLGTNFGLEPLIGKPLAIVDDARLSGKADAAVVAERLLSVSGEGGLSIDRKYRPSWTGCLPTRFLILTNELPRIADASGTLASRFIVLALDRSFYGTEDLGLADRLLRELPGILNWSLDGLASLAARGHFRQPASAREAVEELETLASPVGAFIRERCAVGPTFDVEAGRLFDAWKAWCTDNGRREPGTVQVFGRDLRAIVPSLHVYRPRAESGERERRYQGIDLQW